ncbi:MAG TPA: hypothetical protein VMF61_13240 [Candidatus Acidoferrales bacterium]|nr:hypothetical protein [Candidatus Acidoferrales bacterium]
MRDASSARVLRVSPWLLLLLGILPAISFAQHFGGRMVLGWDSEPPLRPDLFLHWSLSTWNWRAYLGQPNVFQITQAPLAIVYLVFSVFGVAFADKAMLTVLFVAPALTMYYCVRRMFPREPWMALLAAWCYALSPLLFVRYYVPIMTVQMDYALLPLLTNAMVDVARNGATAKRLLRLAAVEILMWPCANNLAYWVVPYATAFAVAFALGARWVQLRRALAITILVNLFWIVPLVLFGLLSGRNVEREAITKAYTAGVRQDVSEGSGLAYTLRMSSRAETGAGDFYGPYWTYARALENGLVAAPYYAWVLLAAVGLALRRHDRRIAVCGVLLCVALFVMKGESPPLGVVLQVLYRIPLLGTVFRNGNDKLMPMAGFAMAVMIAAATVALARRTAYARPSFAAVLLAVLAMAFPYWTGQMFMVRPHGPTLSSMPPPEAFAFARGLDRLPSRVLFVPVSDNPQLLATTWRFFGPNVYGSMTDAGFVANPNSTLNAPGADDVTDALYQSIADRDVATFAALTRDAGVGYVFVAHDMDATYYGGPSPATMDSFLANLPGTQVASAAGNYTLWKLDWVGAVPLGLQRRPIASYDVPFAEAVALEPRCGDAALALVPLANKASCTLRESTKFSDDPNAPVVVDPARARLRGGRLVIERDDGARVAVAMPPGTRAVSLASDTIGPDPVPLSLTPCRRYRALAYAAEGPAVPIVPTFAFPAPDGAYVPLHDLQPNADLIELPAAADGMGASVTVQDPVTSDSVIDLKHIDASALRLLVTPMPGRAYQLVFGTAGPPLPARSFVRSIASTPMRRDGQRDFIAPPENGACAAPVAGRAYEVLNPTVTATLAVDGQRLLVRRLGAPAGEITGVPIRSGSEMVGAGIDVADQTGYDLGMPTGAPVTLHLYRAGPTRRLALQKMQGEYDLTVSNADLAGGTAALRANTEFDQWMRISLDRPCSDLCVVTVRASSLSGLFGLAVVARDSGRLIAEERSVSKPAISVAFHDEPGDPKDLYVYVQPYRNGDYSALQVGSISMTPVVPIGTASVTLPRTIATLPSDTKSVLVNANAAPPVRLPPFDGTRVAPVAAPTVLVLDTQFDALWTTLVLRAQAPFVYFPAHVVADGYKNGWIVPAGMSGGLVHFYLLDLLAAIGLGIVALTLAWLIAGWVRESARAM